MSVGLGLLKKLILEKRSISFLMDHGFKAEMFKDDEAKIFNFIARHFRQYGQVPKVATVEKKTGVKFGKFPNEPIGFWMDAVHDRTQTQYVLDASAALREAVKMEDLDEAQRVAKDLVLSMELRNPIDRVVTLEEAKEEVIKAHNERQVRASLGGVPFGIPYLDAVSDGAQPEDTIALVGRPGAGKSYILLSMALAAYLSGEFPLFLSMEMSTTQCTRRLMALHAGVTATLIRLGRLSPYAMKKLVKDFDTMIRRTQRPFKFLQGSLQSTVEDLALRIQEIRPSVLYVDGAYLMRTRTKTAARWERVSESAEFLKMVAREFHIPVIATYQFNRKGPGSLGNIAFSDVIGQLASIVCGIDDEEKEDRDVIDPTWVTSFYKLLMLLKGREGEKGVVRMLYDMERMEIKQVEVIKGYRLPDEDQEEDRDE